MAQTKDDAARHEKQLQQQIQALTQQKSQLEEHLKKMNQLCQTRGEQIENLGRFLFDSCKNHLYRFGV